MPAAICVTFDLLQTDGLIWVVDSADRRRLRDCKEELFSVLKQEVSCADSLSPYALALIIAVSAQKLAGASLLIFANKQDLDGALSCEEIATVLELDGDAFKSRHWNIVPCSAVTGDGLVTGIDWMVEDIAGRIFVGE